MSMTGKIKKQSLLAPEELAAWLRRMADAVEDGSLPADGDADEAVPLEGWLGIKLSVKRALSDGVRAKLSVKFPKAPAGSSEQLLDGEPSDTDDADMGEGAPPRYTSLKKHMKYTFKIIGAALSAGQGPPAAETRSFIADSLLMLTYSGKGEPHYPEYARHTQGFEAAFAAGDLEGMKASYQELARLKRECHARYA